MIEINLNEPDWLNELREEKTNLHARIERLQSALIVAPTDFFGDGYSEILNAQLNTMQTYECILQKRIDIYKKENK